MVRTALAYFATYIVWGSTFLAIRVAVQHMAPFPMAGARFLLAGLIVLLVTLRRPRGMAMKWWQTVLTGGLFTLGTHGIVSHVSLRTPSGAVAVLMATVPLFAALVGWRMDHERPPARLFLALVLGLTGVAVLAWPTDAGGTLSVLDALWLLGAALCWATGSVLTKHWSHGVDTVRMAGNQMLAGGTLLMLASGLSGQGWLPEWPGWTGALAVVYLAAFGTILAYFSYLYLMRRTTVTKASSYTFVNPVVAVLLGALLGGEEITWRLLAATPIIVTTVILTLRSPDRPLVARPSPPCEAGPTPTPDRRPSAPPG